MISNDKIEMIPIKAETTTQAWIHMLAENATDEPITEATTTGKLG